MYTLKDIIKKMTAEPEKFDELIISTVDAEGIHGLVRCASSNDPGFGWWEDRNGSKVIPFSDILRKLNDLRKNGGLAVKIISWKELDDEEAYD